MKAELMRGGHVTGNPETLLESNGRESAEVTFNHHPRRHAFIPDEESRGQLLEVLSAMNEHGIADKTTHLPIDELGVTIAKFHLPILEHNFVVQDPYSRYRILNNLRFYDLRLNERLNRKWRTITVRPVGYDAFSYKKRNALAIELEEVRGENQAEIDGIRAAIKESAHNMSRYIIQNFINGSSEHKFVDIVRTPRFERPHLTLAYFPHSIAAETLNEAEEKAPLPETLTFELNQLRS